MPPATTLTDAYDALDPQPIDFRKQADLYVEPPPRVHDDGTTTPGPMEEIRREFLHSSAAAKMFLAGHVGSGKSTQLRRLAADPVFSSRFSIAFVQLEATELPFLDAAQLLFHMAASLHEHGRELGIMRPGGAWQKHVQKLDEAIYGKSGKSLERGNVGYEINLFFVKLRGDLKVSEQRRKQFREIGETRRTILQDLLKDLSVEIELGLQGAGKPSALLVVIDDLDKVHGTESQRDLFGTNLAALFEPRFRVLYTLPTAMLFDPSRRALLQAAEHIYPERVLDKARRHFDPMKALLDDAIPFFREALHRRLHPDLVESDTVSLAAAYSGGVVRDYFHLLKKASGIAEQRGGARIDTSSVRGAIRDERLRLTRSLDRDDYRALLSVHTTNDRGNHERDRRLLDLGYVLECYNDETWYEAHPLLWHSLEKRAREGD